MTGRGWTVPELVYLARVWGTAKAEVIAAEMSCEFHRRRYTRNTVIGQAHRLGLEMTPSQRTAITRLPQLLR